MLVALVPDSCQVLANFVKLVLHGEVILLDAHVVPFVEHVEDFLSDDRLQKHLLVDVGDVS